MVQEEAWHLLKSPTFAEMQQENFKLARQFGATDTVAPTGQRLPVTLIVCPTAATRGFTATVALAG